jgi:Fe-S cluster assembly iron-binding protein IscA
LGMALDESIDGLEKLESNGITTYIDPNLYQQLSVSGDINIDYVDEPMRKGFHIGFGSCGSGGGCSC